jgi:hypothetical protein
MTLLPGGKANLSFTMDLGLGHFQHKLRHFYQYSVTQKTGRRVSLHEQQCGTFEATFWLAAANSARNIKLSFCSGIESSTKRWWTMRSAVMAPSGESKLTERITHCVRGNYFTSKVNVWKNGVP